MTIDQPPVTEIKSPAKGGVNTGGTAALEKIRERRAAKDKKVQQDIREPALAVTEQASTHDTDLIPGGDDPNLPLQQLSDKMLDAIVNDIKIDWAYNNWNLKGFSLSIREGQTEGIMISCPNPAHPDKNPSAWINTDKQVYNCSVCGGGSVREIAAYYFGFDVPGYKEGANYPTLLRKIAEKLGYEFQKKNDGKYIMVDAINKMASNIAAQPVIGAASSATVTQPVTGTVIQPSGVSVTAPVLPSLDYLSILDENTLPHEFMKCLLDTGYPPKYALHLGLQMVGLIIGKDIKLHNVPRDIYGNLFLCLVGEPSTGKSDSIRLMSELLRTALPFKVVVGGVTATTSGIKQLSGMASGEVLLTGFVKKVPDPSVTGKPDIELPVKGIVQYDELSTLVNKAVIPGSSLKDILTSLYDVKEEITSGTMKNGIITAKDAFSCLVTTTQVDRLEELLSVQDSKSGFLSRFVFVIGRDAVYKYYDPTHEQMDTSTCVPLIKALDDYRLNFQKNRPADPYAATRRTILDKDAILMTPEATVVFNKYEEEYLRPIQESEGKPMFNRLKVTFLKYLLNLSCSMHEHVISLRALEKMILIFPEVMADYGISDSKIGNTLDNIISEFILEKLRKWFDDPSRWAAGPTRRELHSMILRTRKYDKEEIKKTLQNMIYFGQICTTEHTGGPTNQTTIRFSLPAPEGGTVS